MGHTCSILCWVAQEDVCHCSCGGVNHGCLRTALGVQPVRSRKISGRFYELTAVCNGYGEVLDYRRDHPEIFNGKTVTKNATALEISKWPELTSFRGKTAVDRCIKPVVCIWTLSTKYA